MPKEALEKGSLQLSKKTLKRLEAEELARAQTGGVRGREIANGVGGGLSEEERLAASVGVAPGGKVDAEELEVRREVKGNASATTTAGERDEGMEVPKEGMVCG